MFYKLEQLVTIELFGQAYSFKADSEVKKAKEVGDLLVKEVDRVQNQQSGQTSNLTNLTILILAALNIAHENVVMQSKHSTVLQTISKRSADLIGKLDAIIR